MKNILFVLFFLVCMSSTVFAKTQTLLLATTTSVNDSGLLDFLSQRLEKEKGIHLQWVSVGTGKALAIGKRCDADFLLVHAPAAEKQAIAEGYVSERIPFMENYFILVGPKSLRNTFSKNPTTKEIFTALTQQKKTMLFVSRGDDSGTHKKEVSLWKEYAHVPNAQQTQWYLEAGQGMMQTLLLASEKKAFSLTDIATWIHFKEKFPKTQLVQYTQKDPALKNTYSILLLNTKRCTKIKDELAREVTTWILSPATQKAIANFRINNQTLFTPFYTEEMPKTH